jgi:hypothetical protein
LAIVSSSGLLEQEVNNPMVTSRKTIVNSLRIDFSSDAALSTLSETSSQIGGR